MVYQGVSAQGRCRGLPPMDSGTHIRIGHHNGRSEAQITHDLTKLDLHGITVGQLGGRIADAVTVVAEETEAAAAETEVLEAAVTEETFDASDAEVED